MAPGLHTLGLVLATTTRLAQSSGASEISVEMLRAAFDHPFYFQRSRTKRPLSKEAVAIFTSLGDLFSIPLDVLRRAVFADAL